jgi:hypothetical protein
LTLTPAPTLAAGLFISWKPIATNTASAPTLNVNSLGAKTITKCGTTALVAGDLTTTAIAYAIYDGTYWQLMNPQAASCGIGASAISSALYATGSGNAQVQTVTLTPTPTLAAGLIVHYYPGYANTLTAPTLNVNSTGAKTITKCGTTALVAGDILASTIAYLEYDGTEYQLLNPQATPCGLQSISFTRAVIHAGAIGAPLAAGETFGYFVPSSDQTITIPQNCTNSRAVAATAATASSTFTLFNCTTAFSSGCSSSGTFTFAAGATTATFTCSSQFSIAGSSNGGLFIMGPSTADTTLGFLTVAIYGTHN